MKILRLFVLLNVIVCLGMTACYFFVVESQDFSPPQLTRIEAYLRTCQEAFSMSSADCRDFLTKWGTFMELKK